MNLRLLTIALFGLLISTNLIGQEYKNLDFSLIIADCFKNDTISLSINGIEIIKTEKVTSDFSTGLTDISIYQDTKNLVLNSNNGQLVNEKILIDKKLKIHLTIGKKEGISKIIDLKKGKIIVVDYCNRQNQKGEMIKTLYFEQYEKNIEFD